jgi:hypothetical protein
VNVHPQNEGMSTTPDNEPLPAPVSNVRAHFPIVELTCWSVYEVPLFGMDAPWTRHFVGYAAKLGLAQVSSSIVRFDQDHGHGATASHRILKLVGLSGRHLEGGRLWDRWKLLNGIQVDRDITAGFFHAMAAGRVKSTAVRAMTI